MLRSIHWLFSAAIFCLAALPLHAQVGGFFTYEFLNLSPSARISALGGFPIAVVDDDVNLAQLNPAVLNPAMHESITFSHAFHPGDINQGYAAFGLHRPSLNMTFHGGIRYVRYGELPRTDEFGEQQGTFQAGEYALTIGAARSFEERLTLGANVRLVSSTFESYQSYGLLADIAALYHDTASRFSATFLLRNAGSQLSTYTDGNREPLPFEIQVGLAKRLRYLPFRLSLTYRYLDRWNILYDDPNSRDEDIFFGEEPTERSRSSIWFDNFFRHFTVGGELLLGKAENFRLRVGYNHLLRKELSVGDYRSLAGFSFGAGFKISRFRIDYGRTSFHLGGAVNHLSIGTNLQQFRR